MKPATDAAVGLVFSSAIVIPGTPKGAPYFLFPGTLKGCPILFPGTPKGVPYFYSPALLKGCPTFGSSKT